MCCVGYSLAFQIKTGEWGGGVPMFVTSTERSCEAEVCLSTTTAGVGLPACKDNFF